MARQVLYDPYPPDIFTELSTAEMRIIQYALANCSVRYASERLHASWARHLYSNFVYAESNGATT